MFQCPNIIILLLLNAKLILKFTNFYNKISYIARAACILKEILYLLAYLQLAFSLTIPYSAEIEKFINLYGYSVKKI